ncbi:Fe-S cluster assembly protein NifU [Vibrio astriarenae]|uniref:Nitrogen fixation protein NifU n=1 Tax=Vibrio astriarenae TaxID=1481923 RepID=A0A7Z2T2W1_9VIBR|nr:Fe-S cluster assembly protein NifU [Vibrio astriarenae]QIA63158.1 Fe-S cluster assembly protein NifU [Vibrio astriarenae]
MWDYSEKVKEHFFSPNNAKVVKDANATGEVGSLSCGDALSLTLKVNPETEIIEDAGFQTFGCGSAIASSSALTTLIIGQSLDQASQLTNQDIADYLDGLPPEKMHCSVMGMEALEAAIADYRGEIVDEHEEEGELICKCFAIDDVLIKKVVRENKLTTLDDVINYTKAGGGCSACHEKIELVLEACLEEYATEDLEATEHKTSELELVEQVIAEVRPSIEADGGQVDIVELDNDLLFISLEGACSGCGMAGMTAMNIENKVSKKLGRSITVFPVSNEKRLEGTHHG